MPSRAELKLNWTDRDLLHERFSTPAFPKGQQIRCVSIPTGTPVHQPVSGIGSTNAVELNASASAWSVFENVLDDRTSPLSAPAYWANWVANIVYDWVDDQTFDAAKWFTPSPSEGGRGISRAVSGAHWKRFTKQQVLEILLKAVKGDLIALSDLKQSLASKIQQASQAPKQG